jgi:hypothetical protein
MQPVIIFIVIQFLICSSEGKRMQYTVLCYTYLLFRMLLVQILLHLKWPSSLMPRKYLVFPFSIPPDSNLTFC